MISHFVSQDIYLFPAKTNSAHQKNIGGKLPNKVRNLLSEYDASDAKALEKSKSSGTSNSETSNTEEENAESGKQYQIFMKII